MATALAIAPTARAAAPEMASGTWQTIVPVVLTHYQPRMLTNPTRGTYTGLGSTLWQGTWTGVTHYTIGGTADLVTGAGSGTIDETFTGRSADGGTGTLHFTETYVLDASGSIIIDATIVGATGDFLGSRGQVVFTGTENGVVEGSGRYRGSWQRPRR